MWNEKVGSYLIDYDGSVIYLDDGSEYVDYFMVFFAGGPKIGERWVYTSNQFYLKSNDTDINSLFLQDLIGPIIFVRSQMLQFSVTTYAA